MLINLDNATPGMVLAEDVILANGVPLISSPIILTAEIIKTLKKYKINTIHVEQPPPVETAQSSTDHEENQEIPEKEETNAEIEVVEKQEIEASQEEIEYTKPYISVSVAPDSMSASLKIVPRDQPNEVIATEDIMEALLEKNVVFGINERYIADIVAKWQTKKKMYEIENIAVGKEPVPAKEGEPEIAVKHLMSPQQLELVKRSEYCWELKDKKVPIQRVDSGTIIAKKAFATPSIPGISVHGEEVTTFEVLTVDVKCNPHVEYDTSAHVYKSKITGLVYYIDTILGVTPLNFDGAAEISVSPDKLSAQLIIHPPYENGQPPSEKDIKRLISDNQITHGINDTLLKKIIEQLKSGKYPPEPITIASGQASVNGIDGQIEYLFDTTTSFKPQEGSDGSVDYKNIDLIQTVSTGDVLVRLLPPTEGQPGKDILGNEIPCIPGKPAILPVGTNTAPSEEDANILVAKTDGCVTLKGDRVEIHEGFMVKGNVDYSTGNIRYEKSVIVSEDVLSGFKVECGGDLEVRGTIEDAEIKTGGNILCKHGFIGQGKGTILCKGDVNIGFMKNQTIRCFGNVNIAREALNCTIFSRKTVTVNGASLSIAGGRYVARDSIVCKVIGNESGIHTILEVGVDFSLLEEKDKTAKQIQELMTNRGKLMQSTQKYERFLKIKKKLPPKDEFLYNKLITAIRKYEEQVKKLHQRESLINKKIYGFDKAFIKVDHAVLPGTLFKIGERQRIVHEKIEGPKTIRIVNFEICYI